MSLLEELKAGPSPSISPDVENKILILDVERVNGITQQHWWERGDLQKRYIHHETVLREPRTTIVCAKWYDQVEVMRFAEWDKGGRGKFLKAVHRLVNEADIIVGHNVDHADVPWLKGDFFLPRIGHPHQPDLSPLKPFKTIDTLKILRKEMGGGAPFKSLDAICQIAGIPSKTDVYDPDAMERAVGGSTEDRNRLVDYCAGDVVASQGLLDFLLPYMSTPPTLLVGDPEDLTCNRCGGSTRATQERYLASKLTYAMRRCTRCKAYSRLTINGQRVTQLQSV